MGNLNIIKSNNRSLLGEELDVWPPVWLFDSLIKLIINYQKGWLGLPCSGSRPSEVLHSSCLEGKFSVTLIEFTLIVSYSEYVMTFLITGVHQTEELWKHFSDLCAWCEAGWLHAYWDWFHGPFLISSFKIMWHCDTFIRKNHLSFALKYVIYK